jgi:hypothetical protein
VQRIAFDCEEIVGLVNCWWKRIGVETQKPDQPAEGDAAFRGTIEIAL